MRHSQRASLQRSLVASPRVMECRYRNAKNFYLWNRESWALESGMCLKESGIPPTFGIRNPSPTDKNLESSIWNPESTAWNRKFTAWNPESTA